MIKLSRVAAIVGLTIPLAFASTTARAQDIVDTAVKAGSFNTLVTAVKAAGLVDTLKGKGPFTVFAPTDDAFAKLPKGTVENLLKPENKKTLASILTYHVVAGEVPASKIVGAKSKQFGVKSVQGADIAVDTRKGVKVSGANVTKTDIKTSNGIIHVIDSVILPPKVKAAMAKTAAKHH
ncbi:MAG: fasciclin domain-containing protein [Hyphomicrobiaceae bacterium]|nr:fasciclin domain-containing protein [Hyphomicrobiaceae bacterium]